MLMLTPGGMSAVELSELRTGPDVPVLQVAGDVDLGTAGQLRTATDRMLEPRPDRLVVDLTDVTFLDSAGLKVLDEMHQHAATAGVDVALVCPQPRIVRLLEITGLDGRFDIHASRESAASGGSRD